MKSPGLDCNCGGSSGERGGGKSVLSQREELAWCSGRERWEKAEEGKGSERGKEMWGGGRLLLGRARTVTAGAGVRVVRAALEGQGMSDKDFK